jgi:hypothetical protein
MTYWTHIVICYFWISIFKDAENRLLLFKNSGSWCFLALERTGKLLSATGKDKFGPSYCEFLRSEALGNSSILCVYVCARARGEQFGISWTSTGWLSQLPISFEWRTPYWACTNSLTTCQPDFKKLTAYPELYQWNKILSLNILTLLKVSRASRANDVRETRVATPALISGQDTA